MEKVSEVLIEYRKKNGLSQREVANMLNVSSSTLCRYEKGQIVPKDKELERIAKVLKIDFSLFAREVVREESSKRKSGKWMVFCGCFLAVFLVLFLLTFHYRIAGERYGKWDNGESFVEVKVVLPLLNLEISKKMATDGVVKKYNDGKTDNLVVCLYRPYDRIKQTNPSFTYIIRLMEVEG